MKAAQHGHGRLAALRISLASPTQNITKQSAVVCGGSAAAAAGAPLARMISAFARPSASTCAARALPHAAVSACCASAAAMAPLASDLQWVP